jgi:RNA polymerase sigma-70 factor (ECF subfamily)
MMQEMTRPDQAEQYTQWGRWMRAAQQGDHRAYHQLLTAITPLIRNFIRKRLFDSQLVEDVAQEVLLGLHKMRQSYDPKQPFETWLFAIIRYKTIDAMRQISRKSTREAGSLDDALSGLAETIEHPTANTEAAAWRHDLKKALSQLPDKQQEIVTLLKVEGWSVKEVAQRMEMTPGAVKVSAHRAYKLMRALLEEKT